MSIILILIFLPNQRGKPGKKDNCIPYSFCQNDIDNSVLYLEILFGQTQLHFPLWNVKFHFGTRHMGVWRAGRSTLANPFCILHQFWFEVFWYSAQHMRGRNIFSWFEPKATLSMAHGWLHNGPLTHQFKDENYKLSSNRSWKIFCAITIYV